MSFRLLAHLVSIGVFLIGSTFSCLVSATENPPHGHHDEVIQEISHECCPEDGHKKQIEQKSIVQTLKKQGPNTDLFTPRNDRVLRDDDADIYYEIPYYQDPPHDRQSLFFTDTIRLLL